MFSSSPPTEIVSSCVSKQWRTTIDRIYPMPPFIYGTLHKLLELPFVGFQIMARRENTDEFICTSKQYPCFRYNFSTKEVFHVLSAEDDRLAMQCTLLDRDTLLGMNTTFIPKLIDLKNGKSLPREDPENEPFTTWSSRYLRLDSVTTGEHCMTDMRTNHKVVLAFGDRVKPSDTTVCGTVYNDRYLVTFLTPSSSGGKAPLRSLQVFDLHHRSSPKALLKPMITAQIIIIGYGWNYALLTDDKFGRLQFFSLEDLRLMHVLDRPSFKSSSGNDLGNTNMNVWDDFFFLVHYDTRSSVYQWSIDIWNVRSGKLLRTISPNEVHWNLSYPPQLEYDTEAKLLILFLGADTQIYKIETEK